MRLSTRPIILVLTLLLLSLAGPARSGEIAALAPFDVVADGFGDVAGIAVDHAGTLFVADRQNGTVTRIGADHRRSVVATGLAAPVGLALDASEQLLVAEENGDRVTRLLPDGRRVTAIGGVKAPRWLAVDETGVVWGSARRIIGQPAPPDDPDTDPGMIFSWSATRGLRVFARDFRQLEGLAVADGAVYAATKGRRTQGPSDGAMYRIAIRPDGTAGTIASLTSTDRLARPVGIVRDRLGALFATGKMFKATTQNVPDVVVKLRRDGVLALFAIELDDPRGLAWDGAGNLYVADGSAGRVLRFHAPVAPTLDALPPFTRQSSMTVAGSSEADAQITIVVDHATTIVAGTTIAGRFAATVPIVADNASLLDVSATAHGGDGLTSASVEASITHDALGPNLAFVTPSAGSFVRGTVFVQAQAADAVAGIGALTLTRDGQALAGSVSPALPGPSATVTANWDTSTLADGTHTLGATASDRAGNSSTVQRTVIVDNTAPETSIVAGPSGVISDASATFAFTGVDNLTPASSLQFAWRLDSAEWSGYGPATPVTVTVTPGPHRFEVRARDQAGNEDPTPAFREFTLGGVRVTITAPIAGSTLNAGIALVRGSLDGAVGDVGVTVNDVVASVTGSTFAAAVPLGVGVATVTAVATSRDGTKASSTISLNVVGAAMADGPLVVTPRIGMAPLEVQFSLFALADGAHVELDVDGDGVVDVSAERIEDYAVVYTTPGLYVATATITDPSGATSTSQAVVTVLDRSGLDTLLQAKWSGMKDALRVGDIPRALTFIVERRQSEYDAAFRILVSQLGGIDSILTDIAMVSARNAAAVYEMTRLDGGILKSFEIRFAIESDGVWRVEAF